jgi:hypothetical protein
MRPSAILYVAQCHACILHDYRCTGRGSSLPTRSMGRSAMSPSRSAEPAWHSASHAAVEQPPRGRPKRNGRSTAHRTRNPIPVSAFAAASLCAAASAAENTGLLHVKVRHPRVLDETYIDLELIFLIANNRSRPASAVSTRTHTHAHTHARTHTCTRMHAPTQTHAHMLVHTRTRTHTGATAFGILGEYCGLLRLSARSHAGQGGRQCLPIRVPKVQ